ncbi:MAG: hypothetical protein J6K41_12645 [Paraprevotella sp.]|nr:hypothetical protein [Paraprevotella sp.]
MKRAFFICIAILFMSVSCQWRPWQDVFDSSLPRNTIGRYDRLIDEYVSLNNYASWERMMGQYPQETRLLIEDVMGLGTVDEAHIERKLRMFCLDSTVQVLFQEVHRLYPDMQAEEEALYAAFAKVKEADDDFPIPRIYTQISALNQSIVVGDSVLGISLDKYLGEDFPLYKTYYTDYQIRTMKRERIVPEALFFYLSGEYTLPAWHDEKLLRCMLHIGKLHWIVSRLLDIPLKQELPFDEQAYAWFESHEADIRAWVRENDMLDNRTPEMKTIMFVQRPTTPLFCDEAPGQLGVWLGCRIMSSYMERHPDMGLAELLRMDDYDTMLKESGYEF